MRYHVALLLHALSFPALAANPNARLDFATDMPPWTLQLHAPTAPGGCTSGQQWDVVLGRCTPPVALNTGNTTRSCSQSCPAGQSGSMSGTQTGTYTEFGWRLPPNGQRFVQSRSSTTWGACAIHTNSCQTIPDPQPPVTPGRPSPGYVFPFAADLVCDVGETRSSSMAAGTPWPGDTETAANRIMDYYRGFGPGRCTDSGGFHYWLQDYINIRQGRDPAHPGPQLHNTAWRAVEQRISDARARNGETGEWLHLCQQAAARLWPPAGSVNVATVPNTGRNCIVQ